MSDAVIGSAIAASASIVASSLAFTNARLIRSQNTKTEISKVVSGIEHVSETQRDQTKLLTGLAESVQQVRERISHIEGILDLPATRRAAK